MPAILEVTSIAGSDIQNRWTMFGRCLLPAGCNRAALLSHAAEQCPLVTLTLYVSYHRKAALWCSSGVTAMAETRIGPRGRLMPHASRTCGGSKIPCTIRDLSTTG